jgi:hypothetical protein
MNKLSFPSKGHIRMKTVSQFSICKQFSFPFEAKFAGFELKSISFGVERRRVGEKVSGGVRNQCNRNRNIQNELPFRMRVGEKSDYVNSQTCFFGFPKIDFLHLHRQYA